MVMVICRADVKLLTGNSKISSGSSFSLFVDGRDAVLAGVGGSRLVNEQRVRAIGQGDHFDTVAVGDDLLPVVGPEDNVYRNF